MQLPALHFFRSLQYTQQIVTTIIGKSTIKAMTIEIMQYIPASPEHIAIMCVVRNFLIRANASYQRFMI